MDITTNLFPPVLAPPLLSLFSPLRLAVVVFHLLHHIYNYLLSLLLFQLL